MRKQRLAIAERTCSECGRQDSNLYGLPGSPSRASGSVSTGFQSQRVCRFRHARVERSLCTVAGDVGPERLGTPHIPLPHVLRSSVRSASPCQALNRLVHLRARSPDSAFGSTGVVVYGINIEAVFLDKGIHRSSLGPNALWMPRTKQVHKVVSRSTGAASVPNLGEKSNGHRSHVKTILLAAKNDFLARWNQSRGLRSGSRIFPAKGTNQVSRFGGIVGRDLDAMNGEFEHGRTIRRFSRRAQEDMSARHAYTYMFQRTGHER